MADEPGTHILIVDDEAGFRELLKRILEPAGYQVRTATNAHEAMRMMAESKPAVAICDVHMPGPTGIWLTQQIRATSPSTAMVLATSDNTVPPADTMRKGVVAYILKPYQREAVLKAVAEAFRWWAEQSGGQLPRLEPSAPFAAAVPPMAPPIARPAPRAGGISSKVLIGLLVLAALAAAALYWKTRTPTPTRTLSQVAAASGVVLVYDGDGRQLAQGSGFFAAPDLFVTNHHVVSGGLTARIVTQDSQQYGVEGVTAIDRPHDLVLLKTAASSPANLPVATTAPHMGDPISVYGAPLGLTGTLATGIVSNVSAGEHQLLQITAPISHGSSGSPVVNASGALIGVVVSSNMNGQGLNFAVPAMRVQALVERAGPPQPLLATARGAGDDRERHQLIGPVRLASIVLSEPAGTRVMLTFDRAGKLLEAEGDITRIEPWPDASTADEQDVLGNPTRRMLADGSELRFAYHLDARGNWLTRDIVRRDAEGHETSVGTDRRAIDYWD